ncbi:hypothetical protein V8C26DRAFT_389195 [Trichoderma gracile]
MDCPDLPLELRYVGSSSIYLPFHLLRLVWFGLTWRETECSLCFRWSPKAICTPLPVELHGSL